MNKMNTSANNIIFCAIANLGVNIICEQKNGVKLDQWRMKYL